MERVTVVIPTYRPDGRFYTLLKRLSLQSPVPERVLIINTSEEGYDEAIARAVDEYRDRFRVLSVFHIGRQDFDHGATRHLGMTFADTPLVLCMTQDAVPADPKLIRTLAGCFEDPMVGAAYARQLAGRRCTERERFIRSFNYPEESMIKSKADLGRLGVKTFFCSDVCAMWRRDVYFELGGFERPAIFNEDMILAGRMIEAGWKIAYAADARVWHSHNYGHIRQMKRNFDLGVSQAQHPELFAAYPSEGEGIRLMKLCARHLIRSGHMEEITALGLDGAFKYLGYRMGKMYRHLPKSLIMRLTDNAGYWERAGEIGFKSGERRDG